MKKKHLKNLEIEKITVSKINGGALPVSENCTKPTGCESAVNCSNGVFCNTHDASSNRS